MEVSLFALFDSNFYRYICFSGVLILRKNALEVCLSVMVSRRDTYKKKMISRRDILCDLLFTWTNDGVACIMYVCLKQLFT